MAVLDFKICWMNQNDGGFIDKAAVRFRTITSFSLVGGKYIPSGIAPIKGDNPNVRALGIIGLDASDPADPIAVFGWPGNSSGMKTKQELVDWLIDKLDALSAKTLLAKAPWAVKD